MSSDPGPAASAFPEPGPTPPAEPAPPTQPLPATRPITRAEPAPSTPPPPANSGPGYGPPSYGPPAYGVAPYGPQHGHEPYPNGSAGRYVHPGMLAAAADRDRTMDVLKAAFTEGRLTKGEFDERTARVLAARTYAELNALVADLPAGPGGPLLPVSYHAGYYPPLVIRKTNGLAVGSLLCGIIPLFGGIPAVLLGHAARQQIRKSGDRGDAMAVAGLVFGYLWISLIVLYILIGLAR